MKGHDLKQLIAQIPDDDDVSVSGIDSCGNDGSFLKKASVEEVLPGRWIVEGKGDNADFDVAQAWGRKHLRDNT